jgi:hypothetical protein
MHPHTYHPQKLIIIFLDKAHFLAIWTALEPGLGIIASSLATLRPLVLQIATSSKGQFTTRDMPTTAADYEETKDDIDLEKQYQRAPSPKRFFPKSARLAESQQGFHFLKTDSTFLSTMKTNAFETSFLDSQVDQREEEDHMEEAVNLKPDILQRPQEALNTRSPPSPPALSVSSRAPRSIRSGTSASPWASFVRLSGLKGFKAGKHRKPSIPPQNAWPSLALSPGSDTVWAGQAQGLRPWGDRTHLLASSRRDREVDDHRRSQNATAREGLPLGIFSSSSSRS